MNWGQASSLNRGSFAAPLSNVGNVIRTLRRGDLADPEVRQQLAKHFLEPHPSSGQELAAYIRRRG